jgi:hypothetical protein
MVISCRGLFVSCRLFPDTPYAKLSLPRFEVSLDPTDTPYAKLSLPRLEVSLDPTDTPYAKLSLVRFEVSLDPTDTPYAKLSLPRFEAFNNMSLDLTDEVIHLTLSCRLFDSKCRLIPQMK